MLIIKLFQYVFISLYNEGHGNAMCYLIIIVQMMLNLLFFPLLLLL